MENIMQQTANRFWQTHFPDLIDQPLTEQKAIESNFWENLQTVMEESDIDVLMQFCFPILRCLLKARKCTQASNA